MHFSMIPGTIPVATEAEYLEALERVFGGADSSSDQTEREAQGLV
jgi:hypothetical protein